MKKKMNLKKLKLKKLNGIIYLKKEKNKKTFLFFFVECCFIVNEQLVFSFHVWIRFKFFVLVFFSCLFCYGF
jgi:hypothetical protein